MKYYIVDAFTDHPFGGNTAGVVLLDGDDFPDEGLMQAIAAELRYSETAFTKHEGGCHWHLRYFTPKGEVELCGHATIATFALLHQLGLASGPCRCKTLAGDLEVEAAERVMMQMATPRIVGTLDEEDTAETYLAVGLSGYHPTLPVQIAYSGLADVMLPMPSVEVLNALQPDMEAVSALTKRLDAVSIHPFAFGDDGYTAHVRDFAPAYGVPEESATGTANAAMTHYLATHGIIAAGDHRFLQGETMGRPSVVETRLDADGSIRVGGTAAIVGEGVLKDECVATMLQHTGLKQRPEKQDNG